MDKYECLNCGDEWESRIKYYGWQQVCSKKCFLERYLDQGCNFIVRQAIEKELG